MPIINSTFFYTHLFLNSGSRGSPGASPSCLSKGTVTFWTSSLLNSWPNRGKQPLALIFTPTDSLEFQLTSRACFWIMGTSSRTQQKQGEHVCFTLEGPMQNQTHDRCTTLLSPHANKYCCCCSIIRSNLFVGHLKAQYNWITDTNL